MITQKAKLVLAAVAAILLTLLLVEISYFLSSNDLRDTFGPEAPLLNLIFIAIYWIGLAVLISFSIVAIGVLINRIIRKKNMASQKRGITFEDQ
ncbi:MAG: hypothetical protein GX799_11555 [Crenarchaeota archaeon]|nr:hypothetical protein [Thermoproteota archaeon]